VDNTVLENGNLPFQLSVIVPVLNEEAVIVATLESLQEMRTNGVQIILVDGGSHDATVRLAQPLVDHLINGVLGRASQMNAGAKIASGDVFLFLHADTVLAHKADEILLQQLTASKKCWGRFNVRIEGKPFMLSVIAQMMNWRSRLTGIATGDQAIFVRREDFFAVGGFSAQPLMEDIALSRKLKRRSAPLCLSQKVTTSGRRWSEAGVWRTIFLMWRLRLKYWLGVSADQIHKEYK
jgi:rSAM/selenodomain-associated transferase 2